MLLNLYKGVNYRINSIPVGDQTKEITPQILAHQSLRPSVSQSGRHCTHKHGSFCAILSTILLHNDSSVGRTTGLGPYVCIQFSGPFFFMR